MSRAGSQQRSFEELLGRLRPHWRADAALPARIDRLLSADRRFGSRDRRLYRELIYAALRYLPWIEPLLDANPESATRWIAWLAADTPATHAYRAEICGGLPPCPEGVAEKASLIGADADALLPAWLRPECPDAFTAAVRDALLSRAPLWVRLQTADPARVLDEFAEKGWPVRRSALLPNAISLPPDADLASTQAYGRGLAEIQDLGSQLVLESAGIAPAARWLDACAGAGGKTLQLARLLGPDGRIDAHDIRSGALDQLRLRTARAGLSDQVRIVSRPGDGYDGVLVDAPCTGSGTWRRSPHLKWVTTPGSVRASAAQQADLLAAYSGSVRAGGLLIYATCSLCRSENEGVVDAFQKAHPDFETVPSQRLLGGEIRGPGLYFWPAVHGGDGFFIAILRKSRT